jgi:hypothetical protein
LPPAHDLEHAPEQFWSQLPPAHVIVQFDPAVHVCEHPPPAQANVHVDPGSHVCVQPPPAQSVVHVLPAGQTWAQLPVGQSPRVTLPELPLDELDDEPPLDDDEPPLDEPPLDDDEPPLELAGGTQLLSRSLSSSPF